MIEVLIYIITIFFIFFLKKRYKGYINSFTIIILPYVIILFFNNHFATKLGFIEINEDTQLMLFAGLLCFFSGNVLSMFFLKNTNGYSSGMKKEFTELIRIEKFLPYIRLVLFIRIVQIIILYARYGIDGLMANDFELLLTRGWVAHLLLSIFPLMFVIFYKWLEEKKRYKEYIVLYSIFLVLAFIETEKAQVLSLIIGTFLYCASRNKKYLVTGAVLIVSSVALLFIGNYFIKLTLQGYAKDVEGVYYTYRLWNYIAGGLISSNHVTSAMNVSTNALDFLINCILAFPNMFINRIFGEVIGPSVYENLPVVSSFPAVTEGVTGFRYQTGNVVSTMTMMWGNGNLLAFIPICLLWGMVSEIFYIKFRRSNRDTDLIMNICFMTFSFLSFFSSYYTLPSFYERLIWCWIIGILSRKKIVFRR